MSENSSQSSPRDYRLSGLPPLFFETTVGDFELFRGPAHQDRVRGLVVDTDPFRSTVFFAPTRTRTFVAIERREAVGSQNGAVQCVCACGDWCCWSGDSSPFGLKLWPHPQVDQLFGLLTTTPLPATLAAQATLEPSRHSLLLRSTRTLSH